MRMDRNAALPGLLLRPGPAVRAGLVGFSIAEQRRRAYQHADHRGANRTVNQVRDRLLNQRYERQFRRAERGRRGLAQTVTFTNTGATALTINSLTMGKQQPCRLYALRIMRRRSLD
jgi:hypothetical protein